MKPHTSHRTNLDAGEQAFGLIEIVISMFLLALLAMAFLPLLITSLKTIVRSSTIATATQLVSQQMERARTIGNTCTALTAFAAETLAAETDARGTKYQPSRTVGACPAIASSYPITVRVTISVSVVGASIPAPTASTLVFLGAP